MLKRLDETALLVIGGFVLSSVALRREWTETTVFLLVMVGAGVVTFLQRRLARSKA